MALSVAQILKLREGGAVRVVSTKDTLDVTFDASAARARTEAPANVAQPAAPKRAAPEPAADPAPVDALDLAETWNGPIPPSELD